MIAAILRRVWRSSRPRCRCAGLKAAAISHDRNAIANCRATQPGTVDAPWRTGADAHPACRTGGAVQEVASSCPGRSATPLGGALQGRYPPIPSVRSSRTIVTRRGFAMEQGTIIIESVNVDVTQDAEKSAELRSPQLIVCKACRGKVSQESLQGTSRWRRS